jgi:hypothetical protein
MFGATVDARAFEPTGRPGRGGALKLRELVMLVGRRALDG